MEHASRDCFKDGGALAEVMSLCEKVNEDSLENQLEENTNYTNMGSHQLAIEV